MKFQLLIVLLLVVGGNGCSKEEEPVVLPIDEQPVVENQEHFLRDQQKVLEQAKGVEALILDRDLQQRKKLDAMQ